MQYLGCQARKLDSFKKDKPHWLTSNTSWHRLVEVSTFLLAKPCMENIFCEGRRVTYILLITSQTCKWVHATITTFNNRSYYPHTAQLTQNPIKKGLGAELGDKLRYLPHILYTAQIWLPLICILYWPLKEALQKNSSNELVKESFGQSTKQRLLCISSIRYKKASSSLGHWVCV